MNCSIVIRTYNESQHLGRMLEGISHQTLKDVEIILVDSGSMDATLSIAESFRARIVRIPSDEFTFGRSPTSVSAPLEMSTLSLPAHTSIRFIRIGWRPSCARLKTSGLP